MSQTVERWDIFELELRGPSNGNPFIDVQVSAEFRLGNRTVMGEGFYDGDGVYRVRFSPDTAGDWQYTITSKAESLRASGSFTCTPAKGGNHGPVIVAGIHDFAYADGTPHVSIGTTCYAWLHQPQSLQDLTIRTLEAAPFNKLRMCVFPKEYLYNKTEPECYPFVRKADGTFDLERFDPVFWRNFERRLAQLRQMNIEADIIIFHPYDGGRWGFDRMSAEADDRYLRYLVARISAYRNVWWSFANEWDLMKTKTLGDWDRFFQLVQQYDPHQRLRSVHNCGPFYDHNKPWVTHASVQRPDTFDVAKLREQYRKPIVYDEVCYEGNIEFNWGNITAQELTRRFWDAHVRGGHCGHGETYVHPQDILWWGKGGELHGESPARIAFLRKILEEAPGPLTPVSGFFGWQHMMGCGTWKQRYYLAYFSFYQPAKLEIKLPEDRRYRLEIIDTWNMTITPVDGTFSGKFMLPLPGKQYIALRMTQVE